VDTQTRILDAALRAFATRGFEATSLDHLANELGVRKQTILYWFESKDALLASVIDRSAEELSAVLEDSLATSGAGFGRVEGVVRSVFRLAARRPELLGLLREVSRLGPPAAPQLMGRLDPLIQRAANFLAAEMDAGAIRRQDPRLLLLSTYSTVVGVATEVEVLRGLGIETTTRSLVRRRQELLAFLRSALGVQTASAPKSRKRVSSGSKMAGVAATTVKPGGPPARSAVRAPASRAINSPAAMSHGPRPSSK
jgi:AcrR family transcriptional regulator